jgi:hypothetical protein
MWDSVVVAVERKNDCWCSGEEVEEAARKGGCGGVGFRMGAQRRRAIEQRKEGITIGCGRHGADARWGREQGRTHWRTHERAEEIRTSFFLHFIIFRSRD